MVTLTLKVNVTTVKGMAESGHTVRKTPSIPAGSQALGIGLVLHW